jgi:undecaprenyl-diphosphatase
MAVEPRSRHAWPWPGDLSPRPLLGLVAVSAILVFGLLAVGVMAGETDGFDRAVLLALREPNDLAVPIGPLWLQAGARDITSLGGDTILLLVTLVSMGFLAILRRWAIVVLMLAAVGGGFVASNLLKLTFNRARPDLVPHGVIVHTASFPSSHAMLSAVTYLTLGALLARSLPDRRVRAYVLSIAIGLTLAIGMSRIYLGVHWPTDVLAGWCLGSAWALLCWILADLIRRRRLG